MHSSTEKVILFRLGSDNVYVSDDSSIASERGKQVDYAGVNLPVMYFLGYGKQYKRVVIV